MYKIVDVNNCGNCKNYGYSCDYKTEVCLSPPKGSKPNEACVGRICENYYKFGTVKAIEYLYLTQEFINKILKKEQMMYTNEDGQKLIHRHNRTNNVVEVWYEYEEDNIFEYEEDCFEELLECTWITVMNLAYEHGRYIPESLGVKYELKMKEWLGI